MWVVVGTCSSNLGMTFITNPPQPWSAPKVSQNMCCKIMSVKICLENVGRLFKSRETSSAARGEEQRSSLAHGSNNRSEMRIGDDGCTSCQSPKVKPKMDEYGKFGWHLDVLGLCYL
jgi:hypothetical protein